MISIRTEETSKLKSMRALSSGYYRSEACLESSGSDRLAAHTLSPRNLLVFLEIHTFIR